MLFALAIVNFILGAACSAFYMIKFIKCNKYRMECHANENKCSLYLVLFITSVMLVVWYGFVIFRGSEFAPIVARLNTTLLLTNTIILSHV